VSPRNFRLTFHRWRCRVLDLAPVIDPAGLKFKLPDQRRPLCFKGGQFILASLAVLWFEPAATMPPSTAAAAMTCCVTKLCWVNSESGQYLPKLNVRVRVRFSPDNDQIADRITSATCQKRHSGSARLVPSLACTIPWADGKLWEIFE
jgi:hypothetical protein